VQGALTLQAGNSQRPLIRLRRLAPWIIHGGSTGACLTLDGIFVSGHDIVLRGAFASVTITCSTLDPGSAAATQSPSWAASPPPALFQIAADGTPLRPTCLWIEAAIDTLTIDRSITGPIRSRGTGSAATITITNSIIQGIPDADPGPVTEGQVKDPARLIRTVQLGQDPVSTMLRSRGATMSPPPASPDLPPGTLAPLLAWLNERIEGPPFPVAAFAGIAFSSQTLQLLAAATPAQKAPLLNRLLLEDAYPMALANAAIALADGSLTLSRCTLLGRLVAHQLEASECILQQLATVDDLQGGCVRFTAWAAGSALPRQYESVSIPQGAPLFTSTDFGQPGYAQLLPTADLQIIPAPTHGGPPPNTISAGAADGAEMGAYARDKNPIRAQALLLKLQEYMPAALVPVIVDVT
jgi:hypothetical protein